MDGSSFITARGLVFSKDEPAPLRFGSFGSDPEAVPYMCLLFPGDEKGVPCADFDMRYEPAAFEGESMAMLGGVGASCCLESKLDFVDVADW